MVELKKGGKNDEVIGHVLRYMGVGSSESRQGASVCGLIFVRDKDSKLDYALEEIADKVIKRYRASNSSSTNPRPPAG